MSAVLNRIEMDGYVFYSSDCYSTANRQKYEDFFDQKAAEGLIDGSFSGQKWMCYNGIKTCGIDFLLNRKEYLCHFGQVYPISYERMTDMLRCYAMFIFGMYIVPTIRQKIEAITDFLTHFGNKRYKVSEGGLDAIEDFLLFIATPEKEVAAILARIHREKSTPAGQRHLSPMLNYIAIANEIDELYHGSLPDQEFIHWFPVFFWTMVTFIVPLRATEMLVTPFNCLSESNGNTFITLRRTRLKKRTATVYYNVDQDYKLFTYQCPDNWTVSIIKKYLYLERNKQRRFLFDYSELCINEMFSLQSFNLLLAEFTKSRLIGNPKYDYARFAAGIEDFEITTAGDSRPIAMANLYYQDTGADICRQLADHESITTSAGYYTNVSETVLCSSIMQRQRAINRERETTRELQETYLRAGAAPIDDDTASFCLSERRPFITGDITDCIAEERLQECLGCRYYYPSHQELASALANRRARLDQYSREMVECLASGDSPRKDKISFDDLFLKAHTSINRFRTATDSLAKEKEIKWQRYRSSQKTNS